MSSYVYRVERLSRLLKSEEKVLRLVKQFGPPHDFPQPMLETVRKQLPASQAVYRLECVKKPPHLQPQTESSILKSVLLRIPERNALFAEVTRLPDARIPANGVIYFGVDEAISPTNRLSPNLYIPFEKIDVQVDGKWLPLGEESLQRLAQ
jgi:hypothetical protein